MQLIADENVIFRSPAPVGIFVYTPWICHGKDGRLIASFDLGGWNTGKLPGPKSASGDAASGNQCRVMVSDDGGEHWRTTATFGMMHARVFEAGGKFYLLGHGGALLIAVSSDNAETWSEVVTLDNTRRYHMGGGAIDYHDGKLFLAVERQIPGRGWPGVEVVLLAAPTDADLTCFDVWKCSNPFDLMQYDRFPNLLGMPFFPEGNLRPDHPRDLRYSGLPGVLETNVVRIYDPDHYYFDPTGHSVLLVMRVNSNLSNIGAFLEGVEHADGTLEIRPLKTPDGGDLFYVPFPGGQMKFHILYDPETKLYWTATTQTTDTLRQWQKLPESRFNLPYNERNRLALYFSRNCYDWCFAGMVACQEHDKESRHYATLLIAGEDLLIAARSGTGEASCAHNGDLFTLHRVRKFRNLRY